MFPQLLEVHETKTSIILIMSLVGGKPIQYLIDENKQIPELKLRALIKSLLELLIVLQEQEILHRDLKPENILINKKGEIAIVDFGFAIRKGDLNFEEITAFCCTPGYSAPEILNEETYDFGVDVYSIGVIFYEL